MKPVIVAEKIKKEFSNNVALSEIDLTINENECVALLGKNGAGKSILLNIILGNYFQTSGSITMSFEKNEIGFLPQKTNFPDDVKVKELLHFVGSYGENHLSEEERNNILKFSSEQLNQFAAKLSGGQQRLLDFCLSIINKPKLLIMDEPTNGMDTSTRKHFWEIIQQLMDNETTIVFTTHYIEEVNYSSDRVILLNDGELIADDTPYHLRMLDHEKILWIESDNYTPYKEKIQKIISVNQIRIVETNELTKWHFQAEQTSRIFEELLAIDFPLEKIELTNTSLLDTIFNEKGKERKAE
ncbi:ABC transporter ATP-binding protein [Enterococcus sp. JM9B]|uniref:ABC transporter ATP-binding protein n=1 Tax=Enterococcus sp. JM9B TaxID=1857216 RepID=UPI00137509F7|nr:ABC transporter ATP-binding protein [Enterococcus sp. JM9B]KAF1301135.1 ABC transporter [Enterococcus sp. JM9B]